MIIFSDILFYIVDHEITFFPNKISFFLLHLFFLFNFYHTSSRSRNFIETQEWTASFVRGNLRAELNPGRGFIVGFNVWFWKMHASEWLVLMRMCPRFFVTFEKYEKDFQPEATRYGAKRYSATIFSRCFLSSFLWYFGALLIRPSRIYIAHLTFKLSYIVIILHTHKHSYISNKKLHLKI